MTLTEVLADHPALFYRQTWYAHEPFMRTLANERFPQSPTHLVRMGQLPRPSDNLPLAVDLAAAYVRDPLNEVWDNWVWCRDTDRHGQRIYIGGCAYGHGFQIHRHIHITEMFGVPSWT